MNEKARQFISIHIPKTGGTSFNRRILRSAFYVVTDYLDGDPYFHKERKYRSPNRCDVIHGHFRTRKYSRHGLPMVVWLRDPVARVVSHYEYAQRNPRWVCARSALGLTLSQFANNVSDTMSYYIDGMPLQDFLFVGVLELFKESMIRLGTVVDMDVGPFTKSSFVEEIKAVYKRKHRILTPREIGKIEALNKEDRRIYNEALKMYVDR